MRNVLFGCVCFASAALGLAQSPLSCTADSVEPVSGAFEGVAELVPDFVIHCQGGVPTPAGQPVPQITFVAALSSSVTSRLLGRSPDLSEALLLIDEPAPAVQLPCPALPCSIAAAGSTAKTYDGSAGHYNVFQATQTASNKLEWAGVPFDPPGTDGTRTLRITNVRTNLNQYAHTLCPECLPGLMFVGSQDLGIGFNKTVAYDNYGLTFQTTAALLPSTTPHNATGPSTDFTLTFAESTYTPNTFKPRGDGDGINQNMPGTFYATASGFYNTSFAGSYQGAGLATQGTRLVARFENVPDNIGLFVTEQPVTASDTLRVQLVTTGPQGEGPYNPVPPTANGFAQLTVNNGSAIAVWEVTSANPTKLEKAQFGVAVSYAVDGTTRFVQIGTTTVRGSLGPITANTFASDSDPVPRFVEGVPQLAFRIGGHLLPSISAVVNSADYAANAPLSPGSLATVVGLGLTTGLVASSTSPQRSLAGTTVLINGVEAPIFFASPTQLNIQIPWGLSRVSDGALVVSSMRSLSDPIAIKLTDIAPHIFVVNGQPLITFSPTLAPGSAITIYGTGFGPAQNPTATPSLTIGGAQTLITFSGLVPGLDGVWQINAVMPDVIVGPGGVVVQLSIGGVQANPVTLILPRAASE